MTSHDFRRQRERGSSKDDNGDAMLRLELQKDRNERHAADAAQLLILKKHADLTHGQDVLSNRRLRQAHRVVRHEHESLARKGKRLGIGGPLLPSTREDVEIARRETRRKRRVMGSGGGDMNDGSRTNKRRAPGVRSQSIFTKKKTSREASSSARLVERAMQQLPRGRFSFATMSTTASRGGGAGSRSSSSSSDSLKVQVRKKPRQ